MNDSSSDNSRTYNYNTEGGDVQHSEGSGDQSQSRDSGNTDNSQAAGE